MKRSMSASPKNPHCCFLLQNTSSAYLNHRVGVAFGEGFLLIRLFSLREERPIYLTLFAANCLKAGLSGDELCGPSPSDHGSLDAWIIFLGPIDWR